MRRIQAGLIVVLVVYTVVLASIEWREGQDHARLYFTDIQGPARFFAVNTTLTSSLFWAAALVWALNLVFLPPGREADRTRVFYVSQFLIFAYLGADDRFLFHETIGVKLGIDDAFVIAALGVAQLVLLFTVGEVQRQPRHVQKLWFLGGAASALMVFIDGFLGDDLRMRLSAEDLSKAWAAFVLLLVAVQVFADHVSELKALRTEGG